MLTFQGRKGDRPIAMVKGGKMNGAILYLTEEKNNGALFKSQMKKEGTGYWVKDGVFELIPDEKTRNNFTAAPSGAGKSTQCATYVKNYKTMNKGANFYLFSQKPEDKVLDRLRPHRIEIDYALVEDPIQVGDIEDNSIVVFDDCDTISDKKIQEAINTLKAQIMEIGRARHIHIYNIQHLLNGNDRKIGRTTMNEMQALTIFPNATTKHAMKYILETYIGLGKEDINKITDINSRWVTILKEHPQVLLSEHYACMLKDI